MNYNNQHKNNRDIVPILIESVDLEQIAISKWERFRLSQSQTHYNPEILTFGFFAIVEF